MEVRQRLQGEIGGKPGRILKVAQALRTSHRRTCKKATFNEIRSNERWRGEDHALAAIFGISGKDTELITVTLDAVDHLVAANELAEAGQQLFGDPSIALWPGERAFFLRLTRRKIVNTGPR